VPRDGADGGAPDGPGFDPETLAGGYFVISHNRPIENAARPRPTAAERTVVPLELGELHLSPAAPDIAVAIGLAGMSLVEFDYQIANPGPETKLEAAVNRVQGFVGAAGSLEVPDRGRYLRVPPSPDPDSPMLLQFRLVDPGPTTVVTISSLRAVRGPTASRNYDTMRTSTAIAAVGAAAGSLATLAVIGMGLIVARVARGLRRSRDDI
jgi:hypothetical protein